MEIPESTGISAVQPEFWNFRAESARRGAWPAAGAVILEYPKFCRARRAQRGGLAVGNFRAIANAAVSRKFEICPRKVLNLDY